jgi:hypothetical protein
MWMTDDCKKSFMEMKWKKVHRYVVYKLEEKSRKVTVDKVGAAGESYDDLAASLPEDDCRYAVFDFDYVTVDNCRMSKIFFITWLVSLSLVFSISRIVDFTLFPPYSSIVSLDDHQRIKWSFGCPKPRLFNPRPV